MICKYLEKKYQISSHSLSDADLEGIHEIFDYVFGAASKSVEKLISKMLCEKLGLNYIDRENWTLPDYIRYVGKAAE